MTQILETPINVLRTWKWCQDAFAAKGRKLVFPKHADPQKTYQWRYAAKLTQKIDEWGFDKPTAKAFINFAVGYVDERKLLHKGLSIFFQSNMLDVCCDRMQKHSTRLSNRIEQLRLSHKFITTKCNNKPLVGVLLNRISFNKLRNIVRWYENGDLCVIYLAVSIASTEALEKLAIIAPNERILLPTKAELYCLAVDFSKDSDFCPQAKAILGNDWRAICNRRR
jgi:hypothetical protein